MSVSDYYPDTELLSQLQMFFTEDIDLQPCLSQIETIDDRTFQVIIKGRIFRFDKYLCDVEEVEYV